MGNHITKTCLPTCNSCLLHILSQLSFMQSLLARQRCYPKYSRFKSPRPIKTHKSKRKRKRIGTRWDVYCCRSCCRSVVDHLFRKTSLLRAFLLTPLDFRVVSLYFPPVPGYVYCVFALLGHRPAPDPCAREGRARVSLCLTPSHGPKKVRKGFELNV
jgi:hypothetical protein